MTGEAGSPEVMVIVAAAAGCAVPKRSTMSADRIMIGRSVFIARPGNL
ncbi:hypothetical protein [Micromonospora eburnea]